MARPSKKDYLLRFIRISKGLSKEKISVMIEAPMHNIWRAEVGRVVSDKIAFGISKVLGIDPDIMFYNMGRFPPDKVDFIKKDPIFFKELIDDACAEPWRLTTTEQYMDELKKVTDDLKAKDEKRIDPQIKKILSRIATKD